MHEQRSCHHQLCHAVFPPKTIDAIYNAAVGLGLSETNIKQTVFYQISLLQSSSKPIRAIGDKKFKLYENLEDLGVTNANAMNIKSLQLFYIYSIVNKRIHTHTFGTKRITIVLRISHCKLLIILI